MKENLALYVDTATQVIADTCFVAHPAFPSILQELNSLGCPLLVPEQVMKVELPNLAQQTATSAASLASEHLRLLNTGIQNQTVRVIGLGQLSHSVDIFLLSHLSECLAVGNTIVLTQDTKLAHSLYALYRAITCVENKHKFLVMAYRKDSGLMIRSPEKEAWAPHIEGWSQYWIGVPILQGSAQAQNVITNTAPVISGSYFLSTRGAVVCLDRPQFSCTDKIFRTSNSAKLCFFPPLSDGMAWKANCLYQLGRRLPCSEEYPLLFPDDLLLGNDQRIIGGTFHIPDDYVPLKEVARKVFQLSLEERAEIARNIARAVRFSNRLGLIWSALNPHYILVSLTSRKVLLLTTVPELQIGSLAGSTYAGNPLHANDANGQLLNGTSIAPALAKLMIQILGAGTTDYSILPLKGSSVSILKDALEGKPISARLLYGAVKYGLQEKNPVSSNPTDLPPTRGMCANPTCPSLGHAVVLAKDSRYCPTCASETVETRYCRNDGTPFHITRGMVDYYTSKSFPLPVRCPACRRKKSNSALPVSAAPDCLPTL